MQASRRTALLLVTALLLMAAACGDNGADVVQEDPTATIEEHPDVRAENEQGEAPIFWRTTGPFESLPAGGGSKVVFRITNGYEEETLRVVAQPDAGGPVLEFEAGKVVPGDIEPPGSYYALNLDLSEPGAWQVTVLAGDDQVIIPVEVVPSEG